MIVDGKALAEKIKSALRDEISKSGKKIRLAAIVVGDDLVTKKFVAQKKKFAEAVGIDVRVYEFPADISTNKLREKVSEIVHIKENNGVVVQLPLPAAINVQHILDAITLEKDPDVLSSKSWGKFATASANRRTTACPMCLTSLCASFTAIPTTSTATSGAQPSELWLCACSSSASISGQRISESTTWCPSWSGAGTK